MLLVRYWKIKFVFAKSWEEEYKISQPLKEKKVVDRKVKKDAVSME